MNELEQYLKRSGLSRRAFARKVGCDHTLISRLANGRGRPGVDLAFRISEATDGAVPVSTWRKQEAAE